MAHQCKFVPAKRVTRLQMAFAVKVDGGASFNAADTGTEDVVTEWRCETCLRLVKSEDAQAYGIEEAFDREVAIKQCEAVIAQGERVVAVLTEAQVSEPRAFGALSQEEQAELLRKASAQ